MLQSLSLVTCASAASPAAEPEVSEKVSNEWWADHVSPEDQFKLELSGKLLFLAEILQMAESIGDKVSVDFFYDS